MFQDSVASRDVVTSVVRVTDNDIRRLNSYKKLLLRDEYNGDRVKSILKEVMKSGEYMSLDEISRKGELKNTELIESIFSLETKKEIETAVQKVYREDGGIIFLFKYRLRH